MTRHDVAVYLPAAAELYERAREGPGGAERQTTLLARALAADGYRVAQIVYPVADPVPLPGRLTLVERAAYQLGDGRLAGPVREAAETWRSLWRADARVVVLRKRSPALGIAALYCRLRRRRLIFASANDYEFIHDRFPDTLLHRLLFSLGVSLADAVVVQSEQQLALAREAFPRLRRLVRIPSFVERPASSGGERESEAFLWAGRLVDYKEPLRYVELACAVPAARFLMIPLPDASEPDSPLIAAVHEAARSVPNLQLLEPVPHEDAVELIRRSVAVVNTSRFEGMPNVFLEAWTCGVPTLTFEFDPDGVVARERLGIDAEGSWDRFVAGARELWEMRGEHADLSRRARSYVERVHSVEAVCSLWESLIEEVGVAGARAERLPVAHSGAG